MSKYTVRGSADLDARIGADMKRITEVASPFSLAGVLLGGYGRGEGTPFINPDGSQAPFNDYDLVVVVDELNGSVHQRFRALEKQLTGELGLPVDLYPCDRTIASSILDQMGVTEIVGSLPRPLLTKPYLVPFSRRSPRLDNETLWRRFNTELRHLRTSGKYAEIRRRHGLAPETE